MKLKVDQRIVDLLPKHTEEELQQLEKNCLEAGRVLDKIKVWRDQDIIVDGINRYTIASKHSLPFEVEYLDFDGIEEVVAWVRKWQLGRRNVDSITRLGLQTKILESDSVANLAGLLNCSESSVSNARFMGRTVDKMPDDLKDRIKDGSLVVGHASLKLYNRLPDQEKDQVAARLRNDSELTLAQALPHRHKGAHELSDILSGEAMTAISDKAFGLSPSDIDRVKQLTPVKQQLLQNLLASNEFASMGEALQMVNGTGGARVPAIKQEVSSVIFTLAKLIDELAVTCKKAGKEGHRRSKGILAELEGSLGWSDDGRTNSGR